MSSILVHELLDRINGSKSTCGEAEDNCEYSHDLFPPSSIIRPRKYCVKYFFYDYVQRKMRRLEEF